MADPERPWGGPAPWHADRRVRVALRLGLVAALCTGLWGLASLFPGQLDRTDWAYVARGVGFVALLSSGIVSARPFNPAQKVRHFALWIGLIAVLVLGFSFRGELLGVFQRVRSELVPGYAVRTGPREMVISRAQDGGFYVMGAVNGAPTRFLIDTGASDIVLSPGDARRLGFNTAALDFSRTYETANGAGRGARLAIDHLAVGPIAFDGVEVSVNQAPMSSSLLGMSFLRRLDAFEVRGDKLILRWSASVSDPAPAP